MKNVQPSRLNLRFASGKWRQIPQADCTVRKALEARQVVFVEDMFDHGVRGAIEPCGVVVIRNFYGDYSPGANIGAAPYTRHCFELSYAGFWVTGPDHAARFSASLSATPSVNVTPSMTKGNWLAPFNRRQVFAAA